MSPKGNHTLTIINGTEDYDLLRTSLSDLIEEVKNMSSLMIGDVTFPIEFYLCGDLKFLAVVECATATYSCVWCTCASSEQHDMSKEWSITDTGKGARTVDSIIFCHKKPKNKRLGCIHPPLFQTVPIDHTIPDILHIYLRITDVLFNLLITDIQRYDGIKNLTATTDTDSTFLYQLEFLSIHHVKYLFIFLSARKLNSSLGETSWDLKNIHYFKKLFWKNFSQSYQIFNVYKSCGTGFNNYTLYSNKKKFQVMRLIPLEKTITMGTKFYNGLPIEKCYTIHSYSSKAYSRFYSKI